MTPVQVYEAAVAAVDRTPPPAYVGFTFVDHSTQHNSYGHSFPGLETVRVLVRTSDGRAIVFGIKNQDGSYSRPVTMRQMAVGDQLAESWTAPRDFELFPTADPGLASTPPSAEDFFSPQTSGAAPPTIATVVAHGSLPYDVTDLGDTQIDSRDVYHLGLTPKREGSRFRLRELWIDKTTMLPVRYVVMRFVPYDYVPFTYPVTVDTEVLDGHWINVQLSGHFSRLGANNATVSGDSQWGISDIVFPPSEPDWVFDIKAWNAHKGEPIAGLAPSCWGAHGIADCQP